MAKIPSFFLGGDIPKAAVGDVLEAMYLAGGTSFNIKPIAAEPRLPKNGAVPALPAPGSVRSRVQAYIASQSAPFTMDQMVKALGLDEHGRKNAYGAIHALKALKRVRATVRKGKHVYVRGVTRG